MISGTSGIARLATVGILFARAAMAQPQVAVSPGQQTGSPGATVEFAFGFEGDGAVVAGLGFDIVYPADAPYEPVDKGGGVVDCTIEPGANSDGDLVFFDPARNLFAVSFGDFSSPIEPIGKSGVIERCRVKIKDDAAFGTYPLQCGAADTASANDANGNPLTIECTDGELLVIGGGPARTPTSTPTPTFTAAAPSSPTATPPLIVALAEDISAEATEIPLTDASGFPNTGTIRIGNETITYAGRTGNLLTGAVRGANAEPHEAGDRVELVQVSGGGGGGGGCQIAGPVASGSAWWLLPQAVLFRRRRRAR